MRSDQKGQALIETLLLGLLLLAPLLWGLGVLADLHRTALAAAAAAREAGFEVSRSTTRQTASAAALKVVDQAFRDHGLDPSKVELEMSLSRLERGAPIQIRLSYPVDVLSAPFLGRVSDASIWIHAKSVARVDPFRSRR
jgi:hypothetical protein